MASLFAAAAFIALMILPEIVTKATHINDSGELFQTRGEFLKAEYRSNTMNSRKSWMMQAAAIKQAGSCTRKHYNPGYCPYMPADADTSGEFFRSRA